MKTISSPVAILVAAVFYILHQANAAPISIGKPMGASSVATGYSPIQSGVRTTNVGWLAATSAFPQWLVVDLGALYDLSEVQQSFGATDVWSYKIEGSNDDYDNDVYWTTLADNTRGLAGQTFNTPVTGRFRYVRLFVVGSKENSASSVVFKVAGSLAVQSSANVPTPQPAATGNYLVGAQSCNLWANKVDWETIQSYPDRASIMGAYDEAADVSTDWQIKEAIEHGISFMQPCWFRLAGNEGSKAVMASYDHFLNSIANSATYRAKMKFDIDWINEGPSVGGVAGVADFTNNLVPYWIKTYFSRANYLKVGGKPVLAIYDYELFISQMGGLAKAQQAVTAFRSAVSKAGYSGLILETQQSGSTTPAHHWVIGNDPRGRSIEFGNFYTGDYDHTNADAAAAGFDAVFAYHIPTFTDLMVSQHPNDQQVAAEQVQAWSNWLSYSALPTIVTVSMGWNSAPWGENSDTWKLTPSDWGTLLELAKTAMSARATGLTATIVLLDNWNEYGEGHDIAPTTIDGYGYLDAVGSVFSPGWPTSVSTSVDTMPDIATIPQLLTPAADTN